MVPLCMCDVLRCGFSDVEVCLCLRVVRWIQSYEFNSSIDAVNEGGSSLNTNVRRASEGKCLVDVAWLEEGQHSTLQVGCNQKLDVHYIVLS